MCVKDAENVDREIESLDNNNKLPGPLHCEVLHTQMEKWDKESSERKIISQSQSWSES